MGQYVDYYCENECRELNKIINNILQKRFGWVLQKDYDDFYDIGLQVVWKCETSFDETKGATFHTYLIGCLDRKIKTYVTRMNRQKRSLRDEKGKILHDISLENLVNAESGVKLEDLLTETKRVDANEYSENFERYLNNLNKPQRMIATLLIRGYNTQEIKDKLKMSSKDYQINFNALKRYENISLLHIQ